MFFFKTIHSYRKPILKTLCKRTPQKTQNWGYCSEPGADPDALLGDSALDHHVKEPKKVTVQQVDTLSVAEGSDSALRSTERK